MEIEAEKSTSDVKNVHDAPAVVGRNCKILNVIFHSSQPITIIINRS
jgi:hypothetical protein